MASARLRNIFIMVCFALLEFLCPMGDDCHQGERLHHLGIEIASTRECSSRGVKMPWNHTVFVRSDDGQTSAGVTYWLFLILSARIWAGDFRKVRICRILSRDSAFTEYEYFNLLILQSKILKWNLGTEWSAKFHTFPNKSCPKSCP